MDRSYRQKINKETLDLNHTLNKREQTCVQNILPNSIRIHILFKCTWNILQERSHNKSQNKPQKM